MTNELGWEELASLNTIHQVTEALEQFMVARVISKACGGLPAPGFFGCATRLGRFAGNAVGPQARVFHAVEINPALALWAPPSDSRVRG
ncbi:hypothetical protein QN375_16425 [Pseudomonas sp. MH9.2]|uniref:hypothetical protein n=1 Tax=unclassified Pseudomonas TaxID=196821 RepID=UPI002AC90394|nr:MULTISPECIES: hypothetical protein [unclassified Pseudomonas]MEB0027349.1 hypothetical protein [Pseudomonas sp. MH9.2]MEB0150240.1 hypothetical protein [Pseudomonas sp. CCC2.2]MEE3507484.1 hypothetical protein [Pseudomonas sp. 10C3]WPX68842.1 hypothetical protein RHM55_24620 [Pseudomonas sp. MH9.2]